MEENELSITLTQQDLMNLLREQSEAADALVVAGLVEDALERLLLHVGRPLSNKKAKDLFDGFGPLANFAAKIEMAYFFKFMDEQTYGDLRVIKAINLLTRRITKGSLRVTSPIYARSSVDGGMKAAPIGNCIS